MNVLTACMNVSAQGTVVAVTHDRYFLDNVAGWILELDRGQGIPFEGNYSGAFTLCHVFCPELSGCWHCSADASVAARLQRLKAYVLGSYTNGCPVAILNLGEWLEAKDKRLRFEEKTQSSLQKSIAKELEWTKQQQKGQQLSLSTTTLRNTSWLPDIALHQSVRALLL
eukprot:1137464-Pelagomonas_calceolata.AAC.1